MTSYFNCANTIQDVILDTSPRCKSYLYNNKSVLLPSFSNALAQPATKATRINVTYILTERHNDTTQRHNVSCHETEEKCLGGMLYGHGSFKTWLLKYCIFAILCEISHGSCIVYVCIL